MAVCPKCGGASIKFHREPVGTSYNSYYRRTGVKNSWIFPSGIRNGRRKIAYRTVGLCSDCGYTWEIYDDTQHSGWWYLFLLAIWPIALSVWFWKTKAFRLDKKWRAVILSVTWLILISWALFSEMELGTRSNSIWASTYADINDFKYYIDGNEIYVKDYTGSDKKVRINSSYTKRNTSMIKKSWNIKWNFRKKNQKTKNGDMWRPEKITCRIFARGCLSYYSTNYFVSTFPYIDTTEYENTAEKGNMGESPMKGVPKGTSFLFAWKGGPRHGRRNIL